MAITLEFVAPTALVVDPAKNVRSSMRLTKELLESIRDEGVIVPIFAVRDPSGRLAVRMGHRRTVAAVEVGLDTVPVLVGEEIDDVDRTVRQYAENEHRTGLDTADMVRVVEQLSAFGVTPDQIAKRTKTNRTLVDSALTISGKPSLCARVINELTLDQAALLAEFEDDESATARLETAIRYGHNVAHVAQRLRDDARERVDRRNAAASYVAQGFTLIEGYPLSDGPCPLYALLTEAGNQVTADDIAEFAPAELAIRLERIHELVDRETGEPVDRDDVDPDTVGASDAFEAEDGYRHANSVVETESWLVEYFVIDPAKHGFQPTGYWSNGHGPLGQQPDDDTAREERRRVISQNKAWRAAETVRRDWITTFLTSRSEPASAAALVATTLANTPSVFTDHAAHELACRFLGIEQMGRNYGEDSPITSKIIDEKPARIHVVTLALTLAGYEAGTNVQSWRRPSPRISTYLRFLETNGYDLSLIERIATGENVTLDDDAASLE